MGRVAFAKSLACRESINLGPMTNNPFDARLTAATLESYFSSETVIPIEITEDPRCVLRIDAPNDRLELWTPAHGPEPDVSRFHRVSHRKVRTDGKYWSVLAIDARAAHLEAYSLIAAVVDGLAEGLSFQAAINSSLAAYRELISLKGKLSEQKTIGLFGELLVFEHLLQTVGEGTAVDAWLGPLAEEHDFATALFDAEVKTTLSERRTHIIASEYQLEPTLSRPLWLISIQLTRAGAATEGLTLTELINRVRSNLENGRQLVDDHLHDLGWLEQDAALYHEKYMKRSEPAAYAVDSRFPAINREIIEAGVARADLVRDISYRVDVSDIDASRPPEPLSEFVD